jgi:hypothetical protein
MPFKLGVGYTEVRYSCPDDRLLMELDIPTPDECLDMFAKHARVSVDVARELRDQLAARFNELWSHELKRPESERRSLKLVWEQVRWSYREWIIAQHPRWDESRSVLAIS